MEISCTLFPVLAAILIKAYSIILLECTITFVINMDQN